MRRDDKLITNELKLNEYTKTVDGLVNNLDWLKQEQRRIRGSVIKFSKTRNTGWLERG